MRSPTVLAIVLAGLGAAFLFVPFFYWMGVPLREAMATALLLNAISLAFIGAGWSGSGRLSPLSLPPGG